MRDSLFLLLLLTLLLHACGSSDDHNAEIIPEEEPMVTFAVAGHTYGNPDTYTHSLYPPFLKKLKEDHKTEHYNFLFLTGDVVHDTTESTWNYVKAQLDGLDVTWLVAPGNHDLGGGAILHSADLNGAEDASPGMQVIKDESNYYLVLNTSNPGWTIGRP